MSTEQPKPIKRVLVVDDESGVRKSVVSEFLARNKVTPCPYLFEVEEASTRKECLQALRPSPRYDVVILDISLEGGEEGLNIALLFQMASQVGRLTPIRIVFTGFRNEKWLIQAMRSGVWDYILKQDEKGLAGYTTMSEKVVESALTRLRQLDLREELNQKIYGEWYPLHAHELEAQYRGKVVALWHKPEISVIASGEDVFAVEEALTEWRRTHAEWEQPLLLQVNPSNAN